jgi:hypothetical protein
MHNVLRIVRALQTDFQRICLHKGKVRIENHGGLAKANEDTHIAGRVSGVKFVNALNLTRHVGFPRDGASRQKNEQEKEGKRKANQGFTTRQRLRTGTNPRRRGRRPLLIQSRRRRLLGIPKRNH